MKKYVSMQQVHGNRIVSVSSSDNGKTIKNCDGVITNDPKAVLTVHAADCLPIFLYSPTTNSIGVAHAGWRGLENGVIKNLIKEMRKNYKSNSSTMTIYIGPHICQKHYEVGKDVLEKFTNYEKAIKRKNNKIFLDLGEVARKELISLGVKKQNIKISSDCTYENKNLDSYRRKDMRRGIRYAFTLPNPS